MQTQPSQPAPKPEPFDCQKCDGAGISPVYGTTCTRCDGGGRTTIFDCGCCGIEFDAEDAWTALEHGGRMQTPRRVAYSVGPHQYTYCSICAPLEAIGNGSHLRAMLADVRALRRVANDLRGESGRAGVAVGLAASVEQALLDLADWCGVAVTR